MIVYVKENFRHNPVNYAYLSKRMVLLLTLGIKLKGGCKGDQWSFVLKLAVTPQTKLVNNVVFGCGSNACLLQQAVS